MLDQAIQSRANMILHTKDGQALGLVLLDVFDGCTNQQLIADGDIAKARLNCFAISGESGLAL